MRHIAIFLSVTWAVPVTVGVGAAAPAKPETLPAERALDMDYGPVLSMSVMREVAR